MSKKQQPIEPLPIPAPYDHTTGARTLTQAIKELQAFRNSRGHAAGNGQRNRHELPVYQGHDEAQETDES